MKKRITFGVISMVLTVTSMSVIIPTRGNATQKEVPSEALLSDFNINNEIMNIKELTDPESYTQVVHTQLKEIELDSSTLGVYYFIPVAIDVAGNIQILTKNDEVFVIEIIADTTTSTTISLSSTTTTSITTTIAGTPISFTFILLSLVIMSSIARIYQRTGKRK